jgi:hypothetical protein
MATRDGRTQARPATNGRERKRTARLHYECTLMCCVVCALLSDGRPLLPPSALCRATGWRVHSSPTGTNNKRCVSEHTNT